MVHYRLAHAKGQTKPCPKVYDDLKEILGLIESFQVRKSQIKKLEKTWRSLGLIDDVYDDGLEESSIFLMDI